LQPAGLARGLSRADSLARAAGAVFVIISIFALAIAIPLFLPPSSANRGGMVQAEFCITSLFAGLVGFAELTQRYRDDPIQLFLAVPTVVYIAINALSGALAMALSKDFDVFGNDAHRDVYQVMLASFGSIAFFRSSLFTARVGKEDVDVGPSTLLKSLLLTVDNAVNRSQAVDRSQDIVDIMPGVSFEKCRAPLPALCFQLVEDIPEDRQTAIATAILKLSDAPGMTDIQKSKILGVYLLREVGAQVLKRAVDALGDDIKRAPTPPAPQHPPATG
jgi:hypothetical protein